MAELQGRQGTSPPAEMKLISRWTKFWLKADWPHPLFHAIRAGICLVTACWFVSFFPSLSSWFGPQGILNSELTGFLLDYEALPAWQMWSPLWWSDSLLVHYAWLALGLVLCVVTALRIGGHWAAIALWFVAIAWTHRITWLAGVVEPALMSFLGYGVLLAVIEPSRKTSIHWPGLGMRLVRTHVWLLFAFGVLSQLASLIWWRGDGVWWLVALERSNVLSLEQLQDSPQWVNVLTHGVIGIQLLTLGLLANRSVRRVGVIIGWIACLAVALLWDQVLYGLLFAVALGSYWEEPCSIPEEPSSVRE